jgi:pimeloyl-ACP methyl ester carboxylesterase
MPTFQHDGIRFHYESLGGGAPLVFCHGLTGDVNQPKGILAPLADRRLIVCDARAHGRTEPVGPLSKLNFATFADDLRALVDHLGIDRFTLGGISMGAGIAVRFAADWPSRVQRLILVRPAWFDQPCPPNLAHCCVIAELIAYHGLAEARDRFARSDAYRQLFAASPAAADAALGLFDKPDAVQHNARLACITASTPLDRIAAAAAVTCPTLILACHDDPAHPFTIAQQWAAAIPHAELITTTCALADRSAYEREVRQHIAALR